jgi:hypothetical protein
MIVLWETLALQSSMAAFLAPESKCLLTAGMTKKYWHDENYFL